jgi:hypothetical protein
MGGAALFIPTVAGEYRSGSQAWSIACGRRRSSWRSAAQLRGDGQVAASARPRVRPGACSLRIAPDLNVLLARDLVSPGRRQVRHDGHEIAQIAVSDRRILTAARCHSATVATSAR